MDTGHFVVQDASFLTTRQIRHRATLSNKSFGGSRGGGALAIAASPTDSRATPAGKGSKFLAYLVASTAVPLRKTGELDKLKPALCTMLGMYTKEQIKMTFRESSGHQKALKRVERPFRQD